MFSIHSNAYLELLNCVILNVEITIILNIQVLMYFTNTVDNPNNAAKICNYWFFKDVFSLSFFLFNYIEGNKLSSIFTKIVPKGQYMNGDNT